MAKNAYRCLIIYINTQLKPYVYLSKKIISHGPFIMDDFIYILPFRRLIRNIIFSLYFAVQKFHKKKYIFVNMAKNAYRCLIIYINTQLKPYVYLSKKIISHGPFIMDDFGI